jgi:hypothetical protein
LVDVDRALILRGESARLKSSSRLRTVAVRQMLGHLADIHRRAARLKCSDRLIKEQHMQHAIIRGEVSFRAGDGVMIPIPPGPVDIEVADDSVTLGWTDTNGAPGSTAITRDEYERYVKEGKIRADEHGEAH